MAIRCPGETIQHVLCVYVMQVCAAHCTHCDADDRGAGKCNNAACETGYIITAALTCKPGELLRFVVLSFCEKWCGSFVIL